MLANVTDGYSAVSEAAGILHALVPIRHLHAN